MADNDTNVTLPRASLLTYFRRPTQRSSLPTSIHDNKRVQFRFPREAEPLLPRIAEDEEMDFWGEYTESRKYEGRWAAQDFVGVLLYIALILVIVVNLDIFVDKWGVGILDWRGAVAVQDGGFSEVRKKGLRGRTARFLMLTLL